MQTDNIPRVVVGTLVFKDGKVLLGKRKSNSAIGEYAGPGGYLKFGETLEECAERKILEETGVVVEEVKVLSFLNALHWDGLHLLDIEVSAQWVSGDPEVLNTEMFDSWGWYSLDDLPSPLIVGDEKGLESIVTGERYFGTIQ